MSSSNLKIIDPANGDEIEFVDTCGEKFRKCKAGCGKFIHDKEEGVWFGGRNPKEWRQLGVFYFIFYGCLTAFWCANFAGMTASLPDESAGPMEEGLASRGRLNFVGYSNLVECPIVGCPAYGHPSPQTKKSPYVYMYGLGSDAGANGCPAITEDRDGDAVCPTPAESAYNINFGSFEVTATEEATVTLPDGNDSRWGNRFEQYGLHSGNYSLLSGVNPNGTHTDDNRVEFEEATTGADWCFAPNNNYGLAERKACLFTYLNNVWGFPKAEDSAAEMICSVRSVRPYPEAEDCLSDIADAACPTAEEMLEKLAPVVTVASQFQCRNGTLADCIPFENQADYLSARNKPLALIGVDWTAVDFTTIKAVLDRKNPGGAVYGGIEASINCEVTGLAGHSDDLYPNSLTAVRIRNIFGEGKTLESL
jgi:hypothetical protein